LAQADKQKTVVARPLAGGSPQETHERLVAAPATSAMLARSMSSNIGCEGLLAQTF
jgi:hypothetical protein